MKHERNHLKGLLFILLAALLWSSGGIGIKAAPEGPLVVAFYRSAFAGIALFAIFRTWKFRLSPGFIAAVASYAFCLTAFVTATKWTTAANAIFLQYSGVIWVLLLSPVVLKEPLRRRDLVAIVVALFGMALFFVGKLEAGGLAGNLMALLSGVFFASLTLALRRERGAAAQAAVTWGNVALCAMLLPFVANDLSIPLRSTIILALLGVFQVAVGYAAFISGLKRVTATEASLASMLEPVANPVWVFLFLGERPSSFAIAGGLIVLAAVGFNALVPASAERQVSEAGGPPD